MPQFPLYHGSRRSLIIPTTLLLAFILASCGTQAPPKLLPIKGKVICSRVKSLEGATVRFWAQDAKIAASPSAQCQADGSFSTECPAGNYKVTVTPRPPANMGVPPPQTRDTGIPLMYRDSVQTPLRVTVVEGDLEDKILKLE